MKSEVVKGMIEVMVGTEESLKQPTFIDDLKKIGCEGYHEEPQAPFATILTIGAPESVSNKDIARVIANHRLFGWLTLGEVSEMVTFDNGMQCEVRFNRVMV